MTARNTVLAFDLEINKGVRNCFDVGEVLQIYVVQENTAVYFSFVTITFTRSPHEAPWFSIDSPHPPPVICGQFFYSPSFNSVRED